MHSCSLKHSHKSQTSTSLKNIDGVNNFPLVPADVTKVVVHENNTGQVKGISSTSQVWCDSLKRQLLSPPASDSRLIVRQ
jgi:hypothetical protein